MSAVQLKLYLQPQGSIRRFTVDNNTSYEQFVAQVKTFYHERVETLSFQYLDEEDDLVSFSSQNEWNAALSNHNESDAKLLRIKVKPLAIKRPQPQPRPQFCQRPSFGQQCHRPRLDEKYISRAAPLLKQIFGVDIEIEREEKPQESQPEKKEEAPQKQEEVVEEIIIPEDDEPVEQVYPTTSEKVEQPPVVEQEYEYASQLETLRNMGFTNEKLNKHLLDNFKGDLVRVVNNLVQLSLKHRFCNMKRKTVFLNEKDPKSSRLSYCYAYASQGDVSSDDNCEEDFQDHDSQSSDDIDLCAGDCGRRLDVYTKCDLCKEKWCERCLYKEKHFYNEKCEECETVHCVGCGWNYCRACKSYHCKFCAIFASCDRCKSETCLKSQIQCHSCENRFCVTCNDQYDWSGECNTCLKPLCHQCGTGCTSCVQRNCIDCKQGKACFGDIPILEPFCRDCFWEYVIECDNCQRIVFAGYEKELQKQCEYCENKYCNYCTKCCTKPGITFPKSLQDCTIFCYV